MSSRQPSWFNVADPNIRLAGVLCFLWLSGFFPSTFRPMATRLPICALVAYSRTGSFFYNMALLQPYRHNVADPDNGASSIAGVLSCLSANGLTSRPLGPVLQVPALPGLHRMTGIPFLCVCFSSPSLPFYCFS